MTREEFTEAVFLAESSLYRVAKSILHNDEDCADALQSTILIAYTKLDTLKHEQYFKTWLTRILMNECFKMLKEKTAQIPYEPYMAEQKQDESVSQVYDVLMELEEKYRIPFVLFYVEGYSVFEIHQMLDISVSNVKIRLHRARRVLQDKLKGEK